MARILIVEDEPELSEGLRFNLTGEGYTVEVAADGRTGLERARSAAFDLVLLDIMLPQLGGLDVLAELRGAGVKVPVILLTARNQEIDKVRGLRLGADDYVTKPFSVEELGARIEAVLRRTRPTQSARLSFGDVRVDPESRTVSRRGQPVPLSFKEYELLIMFLEHPRVTLTRRQLLDRVWGYSVDSMPTTRTVDTHVANLRRKLEGTGGDSLIRTVHKVGYCFEPPADALLSD